MRDPEPHAIRLSDYRPPDFLIEAVELDVRLHPTATRVTAEMRIRPNPAGRPGAPLVLDGDELTLDGLLLGGELLPRGDYEATASSLTIHAPPRRPFTLAIETLIDPSANTKLLGLYQSRGTYCTQCEAEGFRRITYFLDRPDVLAVYTVRIEADRREAPVLLSNGNPVETGDAGGGRHYAIWRDPFPKPCYLFALVGGDLASVHDRFITMSGREVKLAVYVERGMESRCAYALEALKRAMDWDEDAYGREYDLDVFNIVAVSDFNMGAMENKGLNIFNDKYILASPETATDQDYAAIEAVVAHEYFHNWTGNRITCRDWFQLCLKEGLTVFRDQEYTADIRSRAVKRIGDVRLLRSHQFVEDAGPLAHAVRPNIYKEINNFYTATVYEKGAEVVRMLKVLLGAKGFRAGMDLYFQRHDGQAATVEDFLACFADATGTDLSQFKLWYEQAGTPALAVRGVHDAKTATYRLEVTQTIPPTPGQTAKRPMLIPLKVGLVARDGNDIKLTQQGGTTIDDGVLRISGSAESFTFTGVRERPVPSLNRDFSAPIRLTSNLGEEDLLHLAGHDCDPFNRFEAISTLAVRHLVAATGEARAGRGLAAPEALIAALGRTLADEALDPAFIAQVLAMPSEVEIAREIGMDVDPDAVLTARRALLRAVGAALTTELAGRYSALDTRAPYSPDPIAAGRRSLKNTCLALLAANADPAEIERVARQFNEADNMTDRFAALAVLAQHDIPERERALAAFYARFRDDPLVTDKWLSLQAQIPEPATLARVQGLTAHAAFSFANPNRVRALIGAFATANPSQFNRPDGRGYLFVADAVLTLDPKNPQVAARLLSAFKSWRALEPVRRAAVEAELKRVAATTGLSADVADIAQRALA
jgi:aminopeptidase N